MLSRYGFGFEEDDGDGWGYAGINPAQDTDYAASPLFAVQVGLLAANTNEMITAGYQGRIWSRTGKDTQAYNIAGLRFVIRPTVFDYQWYGVSLRQSLYGA